jgi:hypothetical protein
VGWRGRRFVFKTPGLSVTFEGPRAAVLDTLRRDLPKFRAVAERKGESDVVLLIDAALAALETP